MNCGLLFHFLGLGLLFWCISTNTTVTVSTSDHECTGLEGWYSVGCSDDMKSFIWHGRHATPSFYNAVTSGHAYFHSVSKTWLNHVVAYSLFSKPHRYYPVGLLHGRKMSPKHLVMLVLFMSGQVELNPGPRRSRRAVKYPCGICSNEVRDADKGICCDECSAWYHTECTGMSDLMYGTYCKSVNLSWVCIRCGFPNISNTYFDSTGLSTSNSFEVLGNLDSSHASTLHEPSQTFKPTKSSTPVRSGRGIKRPHKLKVMVVNCDGLHWPKRRVDFLASLDDHQPDVVIGCESKLNPDIPTYSIFPANFNVNRKDRNSNGGGVFIATRENLISVEGTEFDTDCEVVWSTIEFAGARKLYLGSFYRPPSGGIDPLERMRDSVNKIFAKHAVTNQCNILLCGDFNLPDIDWHDNCTKPDSNRKSLHDKSLEILGDLSLVQLVTNVTRQASQNVLDLVLTNNHNLISNIQTRPGISDHDIVMCDINLSSKLKRKPPRKIFMYGRADAESLKSSLRNHSRAFFEENPEQNDVDTNWIKFREMVNMHMERFIPHKMSKTKHSYPWINQFIVKAMRRRDRMYRRYKRADCNLRDYLWESFKKQRNHVSDLLRKSHDDHIRNVVGPTLDSNPKRFWTYIRSLKKESLGIPPLIVNNETHTTDKGIAEALNSQFSSVFTEEDVHSLPSKGESPFGNIPDLSIAQNGVIKQLQGLNCNKASGPDNIPSRFLHDYATELGPMLHFICVQSYNSGVLPGDWKRALVTGIYKKGTKSAPENYRPVSLTCICCKVMEHIILSHVAKHLASNKIIIDEQHGFRERLSCETQLIQATHDWAEVLNRGGQTDILFLDFSKAFDKVPHSRLAIKLDYYGIRGNTLLWIEDFLSGRMQSVVVNGTHSKWSPVISGVPQGSVLGPTLFLLYINDIASEVDSTLRLFADDSILYKEINSMDDQITLQNDLQKVFSWADRWQMSFNASKCQYLQVTRKLRPLRCTYTVDGQHISQTNKHKYLGVTINGRLDWKDHVQSVTSSARSTLGVLRRNCVSCSREVKERTYKVLVRPKLEFAVAAWSPHAVGQINSLEAVQRQAARFVTGNFNRTASVSEMLLELKWDPLSLRRLQQQCSMFYKIRYGFVNIPFPSCVIKTDRPGRTVNSCGYQTIQARVNTFKYSFFVCTIPVWNGLPNAAVTAPSVHQFQRLSLPVLRGTE